eukprot:TRINITY_DN17285_c0_g1_i1.p1 TRINITY_DN17285_c0_g1~~TRINITY_DN17285_c0_g1_i1.p1  ORF type:complete len:462 (+),score=92.37 TRINITY_DN17285_c0_g1_i1:78-1463(+)
MEWHPADYKFSMFELTWQDILDTLQETLIDDYLFALIVGLLVYAAVYWQFAVCFPKLLYMKHNDKSFSWKDDMIPMMPMLTNRFYPTFWALNQQAIIFILRPLLWIPSTLPSFIRHEDYSLKSDGQPVSLDWVEPDVPDGDKLPLIFLVPGVLGLTEDHFDFCELIWKLKRYQLVIFNRRGHGRKLVTPRFATAGDMVDFREVLQYVKSCKPNARIISLAFSAGTATLYRYLGEEGDDSLIDGAICVSAGYDSDFAISNVPPLIGSLILRQMKEFWLHPNEKLLKELNPKGYEILSKATNVWDFHKEVYRFNQPHQAQSNVSALRLSSSLEDEESKKSDAVEQKDAKRPRMESSQVLPISQQDWMNSLNPILTTENVKRPVLFVHALDDPIFPKYTLEHAKPKILQNPFNLLVEMKSGFHVCFFENFFKPTRWTDRLAIQFFDVLRSTPFFQQLSSTRSEG